MRFPAQILQDRYAAQLMQMDLSKLPDLQLPAGGTSEDLGRTLQKMFADKTLTRMWINKDTQEVLCEWIFFWTNFGGKMEINLSNRVDKREKVEQLKSLGIGLMQFAIRSEAIRDYTVWIDQRLHTGLIKLKNI